MKPLISLGTWAFVFGPYAERPVPLETVIERSAAIGYDGVELCGVAPHAHPDVYDTPAKRHRLSRLIEASGLEAMGYGADLEGIPPGSDDPAIRERYLEIFRNRLEFARDLGVRLFRIDSGCGPDGLPGQSREVTWKRSIDTWKRCADLAETLDIVIVWEFEPGFLFNRPSEIARLPRAVDHPNFRVLFDSCHAHMCARVGARQPGTPEVLEGGAHELARELNGAIGLVHWIDSDGTLHDGETSTHAPFGTGVLDLPSLAKTVVVDGGYEGPWWTVDLCFQPRAWELVEQSLAYMKETIGSQKRGE